MSLKLALWFVIAFGLARSATVKTIALPVPFVTTPNLTAAGSVRAVSTTPDGDVLFASRRGIYSGVYGYKNATLFKIVGSGSGCTDDPRASMPISPSSLAAIDQRQVLVTDGMWSSRVWLISARYEQSLIGTPVNVSKAVGGTCNFTETLLFANQSQLSSNPPIGPPDFAVYRRSTGDLFFTQRTSIATVVNARLTYWFGTMNRAQRGYMPPRAFRTETHTSFPGQPAIDEAEGKMYFPEGIGTIRAVDMGTGSAQVVAGSNSLANWPPPTCNASLPCQAVSTSTSSAPGIYLIYVKAMAFFRPASGNARLFFLDITLAQLFQMDLVTNEVLSIAGQPLTSGHVDGDVSVSKLGGGNQLAISEDTLYIADGHLRYIELSGGAPNQTTITVCSVIDDCSGRAWNVDGLPGVGCRCQCREGWFGAQCENRESWNQPTHTISLLPETEVPPAVPVVVIKSAETTVTVTSVVVGVIANPTIATQASRSTLLFRIAKCKSTLGEELDWAQSILKLALGPDEYRFLRGAVIGNLMVAILAFVFHGLIGLLVSRWKHISLLDAFAIVRYPSLSAFPILLVLEGTAMGSVMLLIHAKSVSDRVVGGVGMSGCLALVVSGFYYLKHTFKCDFTLAPHENATNTAPKTFLEAAKRFLKWLLFEAGKWENSADGFRKRFGGFFRDYRPGRHAFMLAEFGMCVYAGALDAIQPGAGTGCIVVVSFLALGYVIFFLAIVILLPYLARLNTFLALAVSALQAVSAVQLVILVITGDPDWERASASFALASIYILAVDGLISLLDFTKKIVYFIWKRCWKGEVESSDDSFALLEMPMMGNNNGMLRLFNPADDLASLGGSNNASFAAPNASVSVVDNTSFIQGVPRQVVIPTSSSSNSQEPRGPLEHELRRAELEALLEGGSASTTFLTDPSARRNDALNGPIPSLLISAGSPYRHSHSGSTVPNSSSGEPTSNENLSFTSLSADARQDTTDYPSSSSANASFGRRRAHLMPQLPSTSSNESFSSSSVPRHLTPSITRTGTMLGTNSSSSTSTNNMSFSEAPPPPHRRSTSPGKKQK